MNPLISVIVPIYNAEKYLDRCIQSILNQTYPHIELILINDGSTDRSAQIAQAYKDERIIYISQANAGVSTTRNHGLDRATGDIIAFVDSDDWIEPNMYETMIQALTDHQADIVVAGIRTMQQQPECIAPHTQVYNRIEALASLLDNHAKNRIAIFTVNKIYTRQVIGQIRFPEHITYGEDDVFSTQVLLQANKIVHLHQAFYHIYLSDNSITRSAFNTTRLGVIPARKQVYELVSQHEQLEPAAFNRLLEGIALALTQYLKSNVSLKADILHSIRTAYNQIQITDPSNPYIKKIEQRLSHPRLYRFLFRIHKWIS